MRLTQSAVTLRFIPNNAERPLEATVLQLEGAESEFAVIPLKTIDPYLAVSLLEEMLNLNAGAAREKAIQYLV